MKNNRLACAVLAALLSIQTLPASAAKPDTASAVETPSQNNPAPADAGLPADLAEQMVVGPAVIDLGNQAKLKLPAKMVFIKKEAANTMMEEAGNGTDPNRYGLILPEQENDESDTPWLVDLNFTDSGYIKDDDAKEWDVEGMLKQLKEDSEEQNKERAAATCLNWKRAAGWKNRNMMPPTIGSFGRLTFTTKTNLTRTHPSITIPSSSAARVISN